MKIKKTLLFIFVLIFASFTLPACSAEEEETTAEEAPIETVQNIIVIIEDSLTADLKLTDPQIANIKTHQQAEINKLNATSSEAETFAGVIRGTLIGLGIYLDEELTSSEQTPVQKLEVIKTVNTKLMEAMSAKLANSEAFISAMKILFANILSHLDSSGVTGSKAISYISELIKDTLTQAAAIGLDSAQIIELAAALTEATVSSLGSNSTGLMSKLVPPATQEITAAALSGMSQAGVNADTIIEKLGDIANASIISLGSITDLHAEELGLSIEATKDGLIKGLTEIGLTNAQIESLEEDIDDLITAALKKLIDNAINPVTAEGLIGNIYLALFSMDSATDFKLSNDQIDDITADIEAKMTAGELQNSNDLADLSEAAFKGCQLAIDDLSPNISDDQKIDVLKTIVKGATVYLAGKVVDETYGTKALSESLKTIAGKALNPFLKDISMDDDSRRLEAFTEITKAITASLKVVPMGETSMADAAKTIIEGITSEINNIDLATSDVNQALNNAIGGLIDGTRNSSETLDDLLEAEAKIAAGATEGFIENLSGISDDASGDKLQQIADDVVQAMNDANALDLPGTAEDIIEGAFDGLNEKNQNDSTEDDLNAEDIANALDELAKGVKESLEDIGVPDDEVDQAVTDMANKIDELLAQLAPFGSPDLNMSAGSISTTEDSTSGTVIGLSLDLPPTGNVTVTIESHNTEQGTVSPTTLSFTPDDWYIVKDVKVFSVHNGLREGNISYPITFITDSGIRKTVMAMDIDDDVVGLDITPFGEQLYTAAYGSPVVFQVRLMSEPLDDIEINWVLVEGKGKADGKDPATVAEGKKMTFAPSEWDTYQSLTVEPAAFDISEHTGVSFSSLVVTSVNGNDSEYPAMDVQTMAMVVLKALKLEMMDIDSVSVSDPTSATLKITFKDDLFINQDGDFDEDTQLTYAKGLVDQTFDIKYQANQTEPQCLSSVIEISNDVTDDDAQIDPPFDFSIHFHNTTFGSAEFAISEGLDGSGITVDATTGVCAGDENGEVVCEYTGATTEGSLELAANNIFSPHGIGNSQPCSATFADTGSETLEEAVDNTDTDITSDVKIRFKYDSMVDGSKKEVIFKVVSDTIPELPDGTKELKTGFWVLDGWSGNLSKIQVSETDSQNTEGEELELDTGPEQYSSEHYLYLKVE